MLVIFRTEAWSDITMFGDVAVKLLQMMGHSGTVPSALSAADVPAALETLETALDAFRAANPDDEAIGDAFEGDPIERPVGLAQRAFPLIELLKAAAADDKPVLWDRG
jgi:hypothetical protein